jgi:4-hydroxybenzoyl-CoA reductase subunit beta
MATLGGALCSGLRCQYRDQSLFWRQTIGPCLRSGGATCHATGGATCVATVACDLPPALAALDGSIEVHGPEGSRRLPVDGLYSGDGLRHLTLDRGEIVTGLLLPWPAEKTVSSYEKIRLRRAVDRPLVGVAVAAILSCDQELQGLRIATCGSGPRVQLIDGLDPFLGSRLDEPVAQAIGRVVSRAFLPTPAVRVDVDWRRHLAGTVARKALVELAVQAARGDIPIHNQRPQAGYSQGQRPV